MKKQSIQSKILQITIIPFIVIIAVVFLVFFLIVSEQLYNSFHSELLLKSEANLAHIDSTISRYTQTMHNFIFDLENSSDRSEKTYKDAIDRKLSAFPREDVSAFYIGYGDRNYLYETLGWEPTSDYDLSVRPWYTGPMSKAGQNIITYADANTGIYALSISERIATNSGEPAVIAIDLVITSAFESAKMSGNREYFFIQDADGFIIYHPNVDFMPHDGITKQLSDAIPAYEKLSNLNKNEIVNLLDYDGNEYAFTAIDLPECGFRIYTGMQTGIVGDEVNRILTIGTALVIGLLFLFAIILVLFVRRTISAPLRFAAAYLGDVAATGDLGIAEQRKSESERYLKSRDEISSLTKAFTEMIQSTKEQAYIIERLADGDLTLEVRPRSAEDTIGNSLVKLCSNLNAMMAGIRQSIELVTSGSRQIADSSQTVAQGSSEQTSAIEALGARIAILSDSIEKNADRASRAALLSGTVRENAETGNTQMDNMLLAVKEINEASASIEKVIKVIDDIAFQTNILALNAAVEAARAGQHGKGFAVVAEEVRNLAAKSAEAAKDTGGLITNSMEKAALGAKIAEETSASLRGIVEGITQSTDLINEIALSGDEQASSVSEIRDGVTQVSDVVHRNSASAQESAAASEEMSGQADMLEEMVAQFKVGEDVKRLH